MNQIEYESRFKQLKEQGVKTMHLDFRGSKPIEFLKIEIQEETITKNAFHWKDKKDKNWNVVGKEIVDWNKNFIFVIGGLCGIEPEPFKSEKMGKYSYLSKSNLYRLFPTGNKEYTSAEYEFDSEIRAEEVVLKDEIFNMKKPEKRRYTTDAKKKLAVVEMAKFGRQKADSGAHKRGIIKMLKLPSATEDLLNVVVFCFRCIPDMSNHQMRASYLLNNNMADSVFGAPRQVEDATPQYVEESSVGVDIEAKLEENKEHNALYKTGQAILDKKIHLDEFMNFLNGYDSLGQEDQVKILSNWVSRLNIPGAPLETDSLASKRDFLIAWGKIAKKENV